MKTGKTSFYIETHKNIECLEKLWISDSIIEARQQFDAFVVLYPNAKDSGYIFKLVKKFIYTVKEETIIKTSI